MIILSPTLIIGMQRGWITSGAASVLIIRKICQTFVSVVPLRWIGETVRKNSVCDWVEGWKKKSGLKKKVYASWNNSRKQLLEWISYSTNTISETIKSHINCEMIKCQFKIKSFSDFIRMSKYFKIILSIFQPGIIHWKLFLDGWIYRSLGII